MISLNIPLLMVLAFLLLTLAVGFYFSQKTTTFCEYAVGNKQFTTATLVATVLATFYGGGGLVRTVQHVHKLGLYWITYTFLSCFCIWTVSILAARMAPFMKHLSMPETIGIMYGKTPRVITALSGIATAIAGIAIQINVISMVVSMCINMTNTQTITIISTLILVFYATFGGIRAIIYTDVLQFITFSIVIPLLAFFMFKNIGKPISEVIPFLQAQEKFQFRHMLHCDTTLFAMIALQLSSFVASIEPTSIQRVYMSSGPIQAKKVFLYASLLSFIIWGFILLAGICVFVAKPALPMSGVWGYIMSSIPLVFRGFLGISLLAMTMSTADSCLNSCAVMVSHDIVGTLRSGREYKSNNQLLITRWTALFVGLFSMLLTFYLKDLLELLKLSFDFSIPIVTAPFILAVFGFRGTPRTAIIGMATGALSIFLWNSWIGKRNGIDGAFFCMLANGLAMMAAHYLLPQPKGKGWVGLDDERRQMKQACKRKKARRKEMFTYAFIQDGLAKLTPDSAQLTFIGLCILLTTFLTLITTNNTSFSCWNVLQIFLASSFVGFGFLRKITILSWKVGLYWVLGLVFCLPLNIIFHWCNVVDLNFTLILSLSYLIITLLLLPLTLGISIVAITSLIIVYPIYRVGIPCISELGTPILPLKIMLVLLVFFVIIRYKLQLNVLNKKIFI